MKESFFGTLSVFLFFCFPIFVAAKGVKGSCKRDALCSCDSCRSEALRPFVPSGHKFDDLESAIYLRKYLTASVMKRKTCRIPCLSGKQRRDLSRHWRMENPFEPASTEQEQACDRNTLSQDQQDFVQALRHQTVQFIGATMGGFEPSQSPPVVIANMVQEIRSKISEGKKYIVIFPEAFFNDIWLSDRKLPLTTGQVNEIIRLCAPLFLPNVLVAFSFVHQFSRGEKGLPFGLGQWPVPEHLTRPTSHDQFWSGLAMCGHIGDLSEQEKERIMIKRIKSGSHAHVANYIVFYWNDHRLGVYRKGTYYSDVSGINSMPPSSKDTNNRKMASLGSAANVSSSGSVSVEGRLRRRHSWVMDADDYLFRSMSYQNGAGLSGARGSKRFVYEFGDWTVSIVQDSSVRDFAKELFVGDPNRGIPALIVPLICGDVVVVHNTMTKDVCHMVYPRLGELKQAQLMLIVGNGLSRDAISAVGREFLTREQGELREHTRRYVYVDRDGTIEVGSDEIVEQHSFLSQRGDPSSTGTGGLGQAPHVLVAPLGTA